jgi:hypothetical protein
MKSLILAIVTVSLPMAVSGQTPLVSGARVRVTTSDTHETLVGTVAALQGDKLELAGVDGGAGVAVVRTLRLGVVRTVEVSRGSKGRSGLFSLVGFGVGAASALALCAGDECTGDFGPNTSQSAIFLGAVGAGVGALVGLAAKHEVWQPVSPATVRVAAAPLRGRGIALALTLHF